MEHTLSVAEEIALLKSIAEKTQANYDDAMEKIELWQKHKDKADEILSKVRRKLRQLGAADE